MKLVTLNQRIINYDAQLIYGARVGAFAAPLLSRMFTEGVIESNQISYIMATAKTETRNFTTLYEEWSDPNLPDRGPIRYTDNDGVVHRFNTHHDYFVYRYGNKSGNLIPEDGYTYRGRGYVQLTLRANYVSLGRALDIDLVGNPDLAADPDTAARIAVYGMVHGSFTGKKLDDYINSTKTDYEGARRIVNGNDRARVIADDAETYDSTLEKALPSLAISFTFDAETETKKYTIMGGGASDTLLGGSGSDYISGGGGNDTIIGGAGQDSIAGGEGSDTLTGGADKDFFSVTGGDLITDLQSGESVRMGGYLLPTVVKQDENGYFIDSAGRYYAYGGGVLTVNAGGQIFSIQGSHKALAEDELWNVGSITGVKNDSPQDPDDPVSGNTGSWWGSGNNFGGGAFGLPDFVNGAVGDFNNAKSTSSPLILDLDGDGVETVSLTQAGGVVGDDAVYWDIDNDGFKEASAWAGKDDGLLVRDVNGNGRIDNSSELFGNSATYANGFAALSSYADSNNDNQISSADANFNNLRVWKDSDGDGITQAEELHTLAELGITSISLNATALSGVTNSDNPVSHRSTFVMNNITRSVDDVWFRYDNANSRPVAKVA